MSDDRGRFARWSDSVRDGTRAAREKLDEAREVVADLKAQRDTDAARSLAVRAEIDRWSEDDAENRPLIEQLLPGRQVLYIGRWFVGPDHFRSDEPEDVAAKRRDSREAFDPRKFLVLLNIVNPVAWVDAIIAPVRLAAEWAMLPVEVAALLAAKGAGTKQLTPGQPVDQPSTREQLISLAKLQRPVIPLTPEQEAFRLLFGLSPYEPLEEQLAWGVEDNKYVFSRNLDSIAGSVLLFVNRFTTVRIVVTGTHLHLVALESRTWLESKDPDQRQPKLLWSIDRQRITRWDTRYEPKESVHRITFDDDSWIRISEFLGEPVHRKQLYDALLGQPGDRSSTWPT